jgi:hypothetical protein
MEVEESRDTKRNTSSLFLHHGSNQNLEYQGSNQGPLKYEAHLKPPAS